MPNVIFGSQHHRDGEWESDNDIAGAGFKQKKKSFNYSEMRKSSEDGP